MWRRRWCRSSSWSGIEEMGLAQPTPAQLRGEIRVLARSRGEGRVLLQPRQRPPDVPRTHRLVRARREGGLGRDERHSSGDRLAVAGASSRTPPKSRGRRTPSSGASGRAARARWFCVTNPTAGKGSVDLDPIVAAPNGYTARDFGDCAPLEGHLLSIGAYDYRIMETIATAP